MTGIEIISRLDDAIENFGTHSFDDKGPEEVMDVDSIVSDLRCMNEEDAKNSLEEVAKYSDRGESLVSRILADRFDDVFYSCFMTSDVLKNLF